MPLAIECNELNGTVRCLLTGELDLASQSVALEQLVPS